MGVGMHVSVMRVGERGGGQSVGRGHGRRARTQAGAALGASGYGSTDAPLGDYVDIMECLSGRVASDWQGLDRDEAIVNVLNG